MKKTTVMFRMLDYDWTGLNPHRTDYMPYRGSNLEEEDFHGGKSVVFAIPSQSLEKRINDIDIQIHVRKEVSKYFEMDSCQNVGITLINVDALFNGIIKELGERKELEEYLSCFHKRQPISRSLKGTYEIIDEDQRITGATITVYVRLSHFGKSIITEIMTIAGKRRNFYAQEETNESYPYQCKELKLSKLEAGCWGSETFLPPVRPDQITCHCDTWDPMIDKGEKSDDSDDETPRDQLDSHAHTIGQLDSYAHPTGRLDSYVHPTGRLDSHAHPSERLDSHAHRTGRLDSSAHPTGRLSSDVHSTNKNDKVHRSRDNGNGRGNGKKGKKGKKVSKDEGVRGSIATTEVPNGKGGKKVRDNDKSIERNSQIEDASKMKKITESEITEKGGQASQQGDGAKVPEKIKKFSRGRPNGSGRSNRSNSSGRSGRTKTTEKPGTKVKKKTARGSTKKEGKATREGDVVKVLEKTEKFSRERPNGSGRSNRSNRSGRSDRMKMMEKPVKRDSDKKTKERNYLKDQKRPKKLRNRSAKVLNVDGTKSTVDGTESIIDGTKSTVDGTNSTVYRTKSAVHRIKSFVNVTKSAGENRNRRIQLRRRHCGIVTVGLQEKKKKICHEALQTSLPSPTTLPSDLKMSTSIQPIICSYLHSLPHCCYPSNVKCKATMFLPLSCSTDTRNDRSCGLFDRPGVMNIPEMAILTN